nr:hypothetical protein [Methylobacterium sp. L1A1]
MNAFATMVDAQFEDPHLGLDALWRAQGGPHGRPVRVRRRTPEAIVPLDGRPYDLDAMLVEVRLSEVTDPAVTDEIDLLDADGSVSETLVVIGLARIDRQRLVRTCEVELRQPVADGGTS